MWLTIGITGFVDKECCFGDWRSVGNDRSVFGARGLRSLLNGCMAEYELCYSV